MDAYTTYRHLLTLHNLYVKNKLLIGISRCFVISNEGSLSELKYPGFLLMNKTLSLIPTTRANVQCHVQKTRDITLLLFLFLSSFRPYSDLFLPPHCTRRWFLLHLITLKNRHTHTHTHTNTHTHIFCRIPLDE
jgi:hypothetical protein